MVAYADMATSAWPYADIARVHSPLGDQSRQSLPPTDAPSVLFFESYRSPEAFLAHVNGPVFRAFVAKHGHLFLQSDGKLYTTVSFLERQAGFVR